MRNIAMILLLLPAVASAEIYKCPKADGSIGFSDRPCAGLAESPDSLITVDPPKQATSVYEQRRQAEAEQAAAESAKTDQLIADIEKTKAALLKVRDEQAALYQRRMRQEGLEIGMSFQTVAAHPVWGTPADIRNTKTAAGTNSQWAYQTSIENKFERMYLFFVNGVLTVIQN